MFQTLSNIQKGEAVGLQRYIDNRGGSLRVGLRNITYTVGWYNINAGESFSWRSGGGEGTPINTMDIPRGLYGFDQLQNMINEGNSNTLLEVSKVNGLITLTVGAGGAISLTDGLLSLLGLDDGLGGQWLDVGRYDGDRAVNFTSTKMLHLHLDQINTTNNCVDGAPSMLLATVGLGCHSFGEVGIFSCKNPEFKRLQEGTVGELKVTVRDDTGQLLNNHDLPISLVLEIV